MRAKFLQEDGRDTHPIIKHQQLQDGSWAVEALRNKASKDYRDYERYADDWRYRRVYENLPDQEYRALPEREWTVDDEGNIDVRA